MFSTVVAVSFMPRYIMADYQNSKDQIARLVRIAYSIANRKYSEELLDIAHDIRGRSLTGSLPSNIMSDMDNLLTDLSVKYVVIGGVALIVHGQVRDTDDIDVLVDKMPSASKTSNSDYMNKFNFYPKKSTTGTVLTLDHKQFGGLELLTADDPLKIWAMSTVQNHLVLGLQVPVVSAAALVALKIRAVVNNPGRASKDKPDILGVLIRSKPDLSEVWPLLNDEETKVLKSLQLPNE
jgi:hypothetical protein